MPQNQLKPIVVFDGNCQGQALAAIFTHSGLADAYSVGGDLGFIPSFRGGACQYIDEGRAADLIRSARDSGRLAVQGSQATPMSDYQVRPYSGDVDLIVKYPHLQFYAQSPKEFEERFGRMTSPKRAFDLDVSTVSVCQRRAKSRLDFAAVMNAVGREKSLFHSPLHPGGLLTSMLFLDFASQVPGFERSAVESVGAEISTREGLNFVSSHPVAPDHQKAIGVSWKGDYLIYSEMLTRRANQDWLWLLTNADKLAALFAGDTQHWDSLSLAYNRMGYLAATKSAFDILLKLSPGFNHYWERAFKFFRQHSNEQAAIELVGRARSFFGDQRQFQHLMARVMIEREMYAEAEEFARTYMKLTPDRYDALTPMLTVFLKTGRSDEARSWVRNAAHNCPPERKSELRTNLRATPGLDWTFLDEVLGPVAEVSNSDPSPIAAHNLKDITLSDYLVLRSERDQLAVDTRSIAFERDILTSELAETRTKISAARRFIIDHRIFPFFWFVVRMECRRLRMLKFDSQYYRLTHRDVGEAGIDPLQHYVCYGRKEGRSIRWAI